jgi:flagellar hook assembly protein FlgD
MKKIEIYPNPIQNGASIKYNLNTSEAVKLDILNQNGQAIQILLNEFQSAGEHRINWTPKENLPSGNYFIRLSSNSGIQTEKLLYIK